MIPFDARFYLERYPDVAAAGIDPWEHYLTYGWLEGRDPHPLFRPSYYLETNPDVQDAGLNPLLHFNEFGDREGRSPHPLFDAVFYREQNPDVVQAKTSPFEHFLAFGALEGRAPHPLFDSAFYLAQNPDVAASGMNPLDHFLQFGFAEGRKPAAGVNDGVVLKFSVAAAPHLPPQATILQVTGGDGDDIITSPENLLRLGRLDLGAGDDVFIGGLGGDRVLAGPGDDLIDGGATFELGNRDLFDLIGAPAGVFVDLDQGIAQDGFGGTDRIVDMDNVAGSQFDDIIIGDERDNILTGEGGNDTIMGGAGNDNISGYDGNDILWGGDGDDVFFGDEGVDILHGGAGSDVFQIGVSDFVLDHNRVTDFEQGIDVIEVLDVPSGRPDILVPELIQSATNDDQGNAVLTFAEDWSLTLEGISTDMLSLDDFVFLG